MLKIKNLAVAVGDKEILHDVSLTIRRGETHVLFGPNGSGKTTLLATIMGFPKYRVIRGSISFKEPESEETINKLASRTNLADFLHREINYGFSGGEIKRSEMMQLMAQKPELALLDEPESGVDLENIALIGKLINELLEKDCLIVNRKCMGLIITHTGHILDYVNARTGYVMCDGVIGCEGDPHEILAVVREKGYEECIRCLIKRRGIMMIRPEVNREVP
jgi:Fe-S cluster assembly ATP-binding protein